MGSTIKQNTILVGNIPSQLMKLFLPIFFGTLFQQLYNTVDTLIVGNYVGTQALAAVGATGAFVALLLGFFVGLCSGSSIIIAQSYGAGDETMVDHQVHTSLALSLVGGALLTVLGMLISRQALVWMNTPADVIDSATLYLRIYFLGMIPQMLYNTGTGILRAVGDTKRPLYFLIIASLVNIVLDYLFVAVIPWGVAGAALATIISQFVSAVCTLWWLKKVTDMPWDLKLSKLKMEPHILRGIFAIGLPAAAQSSLYSVSNIVIQTSINGFGTIVVAAWSVYGKIDLLYWMTLGSMGLAITTFAGQNFGAKRYDRVKKGTNICLAMTFTITILTSIFMYIASQPLFRLFSQDPVVVSQGVQIMHMLVPTYVTYISIEVLSGALRGCGDVKVPTLITVFVVCLLRLAWILFVVPVSHTVQTVAFSYPLTWTLASIMFLIYYYRGKWLTKILASQETN